MDEPTLRAVGPGKAGRRCRAALRLWRVAAFWPGLAVTAAEGPRPGHTAVGYLLLYNVMFIVPLLGILAMTYFGVRSETLGNMLRKRLALAKFGMAGLLVGLGTLVIMTL